MKDYKEMTRHISDDRRDVDTIIACLSSAARKACDQPEPSLEKTTLVDAFEIRNIYDDPDLKALVESNLFTAERRKELSEVIEYLVDQEPAFPPECYALLSNQEYSESIDILLKD